MPVFLEFYPARSPGLSVKGWDLLSVSVQSIFHNDDDFSRDDLIITFRAIPPPLPKQTQGDSYPQLNALPMTAIEPSGELRKGWAGLSAAGYYADRCGFSRSPSSPCQGSKGGGLGKASPSTPKMHPPDYSAGTGPHMRGHPESSAFS